VTIIRQGLLVALSELGLEDWIPVPEALSSPEIMKEVGCTEVDPDEAVVRALSHLVEGGEVRVYRGRALSAQPAPVSTDEGLKLLKDPHWRRWGREENEERLFFANAKAAEGWGEDA